MNRALSQACQVHSVRTVGVVACVMRGVAHSVARQRSLVVVHLGLPRPSPVAARKLYHNTRPSISYRNREFYVATEDFEKSVVTKKPSVVTLAT